jgi:hypothetical protein
MTDDDDVELDLDLDLARFNTGDTSDAEAAAMIDCWQAAADLYQLRARGMRGTAQYLRDGLVKRQRRRERLARKPTATIIPLV